MADIKDSVGEQAANKEHDVAMVQAMLRVVKDAKNQPYLAGNYDGSYGKLTKAAIASFQNDHKLAAAKPGPGQDLQGIVSAGGPTILKLDAMLPADYKDIRILPDTRTVFWPGAEADAKASAKAILGTADMEVTFRTAVAKLVDTMFQQHKIVLSLTNTGGRRTFQKQYELITQPNPPTKAGPGESNHNFGMAVDIGFKGLKWMQGDGGSKVDDWWLNSLQKVSANKAAEMWAARNVVAVTQLKLHPSALKGDLIHLQRFSDNNVSMRRSLAGHLNNVGKMGWKHFNNQYQSDFGWKDAFFPVGTATQIWGKTAPITKDNLAKALSNAKVPPPPPPNKKAGLQPLQKVPPLLQPGKAIAAANITQKQIDEVRSLLRAEMNTAEKEAFKWQALP
ncbi:MAG: M15 family metallopeptidase [Bryobacterales bacterium]|nr:M15 family metallopeptidase [Bryobacterales bacterium]